MEITPRVNIPSFQTDKYKCVFNERYSHTGLLQGYQKVGSLSLITISGQTDKVRMHLSAPVLMLSYPLK